MSRDDELYQVTSSMEIAHLLRSMQENQTLVLLQLSGRSSVNAVSMVLHVDQKAGMVVFDVPQRDEDLTDRLTGGGRVLCEASLDQIRVSFEMPGVRLVQFDGGLALQASLPERLTYVQRRDTFRIDVPANRKATCVVKIPSRDANDRVSPVPFMVRDISSTGVALADPGNVFDTTPGRVYAAELDLPNIGKFEVALRLVHHFDDTLLIRGESVVVRRVGFAFDKMHDSVAIRIQSFVNLLQREQIARERGLS